MRLRLPCTKRRRPIGEGGSQKQSRSGGRLNGTLCSRGSKGLAAFGCAVSGTRKAACTLLQLLGAVGASSVCRSEGAMR